MNDELAALGDLGAVAVNAGELAQRIEHNLERELQASTPHAANKYSKTLARLATERAELTRELERIDEHCAALETGRAGADDARHRAEQLARAKAMRVTKQDALATTLRQIRLTTTLSERFEEQNRRAFRRIEQSAHERAMRDVDADVSTTATTATTSHVVAGDDEPAGATRAIEREYAHREQMIQMGVITPFENTKLSKMRTKMISQRENSALQWHEPALKPTALLVAANNKKKRKMPVSSEDAAQRASNNFDDNDDDDNDAQDFVAAADVDVPEPPKRGRGRPRKDAAVTPVATDSAVWSDDGDQRRYCERLAAWWDEHADEIRARVPPPSDDDDDEVVVRRPRTLAGLIEAVAKFYAEAPSVDFDGGLRLPQTIHDRLFPYQRTAVRWLWELHCQDAGGIVGDEMGLGKTVTCSTFLAALHASGLLQRPVLIACPATVLAQWTRELHRWYPPLRVMMMHSSGSGGASVKRLLRAVQVPSVAGCVLLTTYDAIRRHGELLQQCEWSYVILDEGHKIRNPNAAVTLACKALDTPHRVILSGAPIQNNLTELWSLFDFVFPGKLGTLPVFQSEFEVPIRLGGFANASAFRVQTAYKCAVALRDLIRPYLLRRLKKDVMTDLPEKTEQVLFCRLTETQLKAYRSFISSEQTSSILEGQLNMLYGVDALRKICNHPDLLEHRERADELGLDRKRSRARVSRVVNGNGNDDDDDDDLLLTNADDEGDSEGEERERERRAMLEQAQQQAVAQRDDGVAAAAPIDEASLPYGAWQKSAKLRVLDRLLTLWHGEKRKALLFAQTRQMLDIVEAFVRQRGFEYRRMDGTTPIGARQTRIDEFNNDARVFVFVLTTKVGGLGVNLIGADRIVIIDPDWNPATDVQARERAWRIGQTRHVVIYRLLTSGTIEEKIYHRQIYKQFLQNKILKDPKQQRFLKQRSMAELFRLGAEYSAGGTSIKQQARAALGRTETGEMFAAIGGEIMPDDIDPANEEGEDGEIDIDGGDDDADEDGMLADVRAEEYVTGGDADDDGDAAADNNNNGGGDSTRILRYLFDEGGVHSALSHDVIEAGASERALVDKEASDIASRAVEQLRMSRAQVAASPITRPTWTGRAGSAGAPKPRFGAVSRSSSTLGGGAPSSSALLGRLKSLAPGSEAPVVPLLSGGGGVGGGGGPSLSARASSGRLAELALARENSLSDARHNVDPFAAKGGSTSSAATALLSFLRSRPFHCATTQAIAAKFEQTVTSEAAHAFRELLKKVAQFDKASKVWRLRAEFEDRDAE